MLLTISGLAAFFIMMKNYSALERFLRYVQIDTQSDPASTTHPSTEKQKDLARVLVQELHAIGIADAEMDEWGYVYATIPATTNKNVPVICLCSHMDTAPDCSGTGVKPLVHRAWNGSDIVLPDDPSIVLRAVELAGLSDQIGNDIVTASGTTLLGADNKAGVAEIMAAAEYLMQHPEIQHGKIRILFTPDEEIGRGVDKVDMQRLGAHFGYTMDGETLGTLEDETFSADGVTIEIQGVPTHPGYAKGKMENAAKIAADIIAALPRDTDAPEVTAGKQGFVHPTRIQAGLDTAILQFIVRAFDDDELMRLEGMLKDLAESVIQQYPHSSMTFSVQHQYRNMKVILDQHPQVVSYALEAIERTGIPPVLRSIRGGTDGSRLSFMGLPCPNIFTGEHAFHSRYEWVSAQDMEKAVDVIVNLVQIWAEKS